MCLLYEPYLDNLSISDVSQDLDDSDFELDLSDSASNISEVPCRSPLSSLARNKPSLVPEVAIVSSASEHRKLRKKIIDNVNTFL